MNSFYRDPRFISVLTFLAILALAGSAAQSAEKPKIVFERDAWDFGRVKQGDNLEYEFLFKNDGRSVLLINKVDTTCGCTAVLVSEKKIDHGRQGRIKVVFATAGYGGRGTKQIYVVSNDPRRPPGSLSITAEVEAP